MNEESQPGCELRRRRSSASSLPLQLDVGSQVVTESGPSRGTPSPGTVRYVPDTEGKDARRSALREFRKKQQSFDIQIEECEEEEIIVDSDDEGEPNEQPSRAITPTPLQDFGANVSYTEAPQLHFLQVKTIEHDCVTDVSDAESEAES